MFVILVEKMGVEEKESAMTGQDQEIETGGEKDLGQGLEIEVREKEAEDQGLERENVADPDQKKKGKVEGVPDLVQEIDETGEIGKAGREELKRMT